MSNFYGRGGVQAQNNPEMTGNRANFKQNTFVYMTGTSQTIPLSPADVSIACATVVADHMSNITATDTITISQTGYYNVVGSIGFTGAAGGSTYIHVALSINDVLATNPVSAAVIQTFGVETSKVLLLTAGQTLSLWGKAEGAAYTTSAATSLVCQYLGPA